MQSLAKVTDYPCLHIPALWLQTEDECGFRLAWLAGTAQGGCPYFDWIGVRVESLPYELPATVRSLPGKK